MGAFLPPPPAGQPDAAPTGPLSPDLVGQDPAMARENALATIAGHQRALMTAEGMIQEVGTQFTQDPSIGEAIRMISEGIRGLGYLLQANAQLGVRDETVPFIG